MRRKLPVAGCRPDITVRRKPRSKLLPNPYRRLLQQPRLNPDNHSETGLIFDLNPFLNTAGLTKEDIIGKELWNSILRICS
jgi:hypothetical protein